MVATSRKTHGGITSVINAYEASPIWKKYHCHWIQTHRDGSNWRKLVYYAWAVVDYFVRLPFYSIVHIHFSLRISAYRKIPFVALAKLFKKRIIVHLHCGSQIHDIWNKSYEYIFKNADVCIFLSENLRTMVEQHVGMGKDFRICYNPCPNVCFVPNIKKEKIILFSGTLCKNKGYVDLIKAFGLISGKYEDWRLVFAGNGEISEGKQLSLQLGIEHQVVFLGWVSGKEKDRIFRQATIFCLPSYSEGFPMAILEAWAYGLPVITTPVGGITDVAKDEENILLFNPGDINALASQLENMIMNPTLKLKISEASLDFAHNIFNIDKISMQLDAIYSSL